TGKGLAQCHQGAGVSGIAIDWYEYGRVHDQKVGIGGRQAVTIFRVKAGLWPGQGNQAVRLTISAAKCLEFGLHGGQGLIVRIALVITAYISNGSRITEACQSIDMAVSV